MAFDGIVVAGLAAELNTALAGGKISKIAQPEKDELLLLVRTDSGNHRVRISANAGLPMVCLTDTNQASPMVAPGFCMLLRKHIANGVIRSVRQTGLDRVLIFDIEHRDEMGDTAHKSLIVELMGKHSNIIFVNSEGMVLDSIKRVPASISSVREVLPGREYFALNTQDKADTLSVSYDEFRDKVLSQPSPLSKAIGQGLTGISPIISEELCARAGLDSSAPASSLSESDGELLFSRLEELRESIINCAFEPSIVYENDEPCDFSAVRMKLFEGKKTVYFDSISRLIEEYYQQKDVSVRIRQKSSDLRRVVQTRLERALKKADLQRKQMSDTEKKDKYRIYGELLNTYGYSLTGGEKSITCLNYYDNEDITIPLDPTKSASENSKKFFAKYGKLKRTAEALRPQLEQTLAEIEHLESVKAALSTSETESDLAQIRSELQEAGFIKKAAGKEKKRQEKSGPLHYITEDGFDIYVGKNNYQNEEVTFKIANGSDWWFHAKQAAGSHVIVKSDGRELPDRIFEIAAGLAAFYSSKKDSEKVEIDYVQRREIKKVPQARPGYVIYHTNFSMVARPQIDAALTLK